MSIIRAQTLTGTLAMDWGMGRYAFLDPGGSSRTVLLPPEKAGGLLFVYNTADAAENLTVKDDSNSTTVVTLGQGDAAILFSEGTNWAAIFPNDIDAGEITTAMLAAGILSADVTGRALMATGYFTEAKATDAFAAAAIVGSLLKAGTLAPTKLDFTGLKFGQFVGGAGAGQLTLTGAVVGDRVVGGWLSGDVSDNLTKGTGTITVRSSFVALFETAITVTDKIVQASATDLSDNKYTVILAPAAA